MKKLTTKDFIEKAKKVHGDEYDYSESIYINSRSKIKIKCKIHGDFLQNANSHLLGTKCSLCATIESSKKCTKITKDEFIKKSNIIHKNTYCYNNIEYIDLKTKVNIYCKVHGVFSITPTAHMHGKQGCIDCGYSKNKERIFKKYSKEFKQKAKNIHNNKYTYENTIYKDSSSLINITCSIHGSFKQRPSCHLQGKGCPDCGTEYPQVRNIKLDKPCLLYYISINNGEAYKVGVTSRTIKKRFYGENSKIKLIYSWLFKTGKEAHEIEKKILEENKQYKYYGKKLLRNGNSELFSKNIFDKIVT